MTPEQAKTLAKPLVDIYADLADELMVNIARRLATNGGMTNTAQWEVTKLAQLGALTKDNIKTIAHYTGGSTELVEAMLTNAAHMALETIEEPLHEAVISGALGKIDVVPASETITKVLKTYQKQAQSTLNLINTVMAYKAKDAYIGLVHKTATLANSDEYLYLLGKNTASVVTGAQSRTAALRQCIKEFSEKGIPGFVDAAGREWSPEAYLNMDIRTTVNNVANETQFARMDDYNSDLIEVSSHIGARPRCALFQGRIYSRSGKSGNTTDLYDKKIPYGSWASTSYGEAAGLLGINCGHQVYAFFPGLSRQTYFPYKEPENSHKYNESQKQRYHERQVRKSRRECAMLDAAGDKEGFQKASTLLKQRESALKNYCESTGRTYKSDRVQVSGFNRSVSAKATAANRLEQKDGIKFSQSQTQLVTKKLDSNVNRQLTNSKAFHDKFKDVMPNKSVNENIYQQSMKILEHRDGTEYEDLAALDARTGVVLAKNVASTKLGKTGFTQAQYDSCMANVGRIVLLHNHPNSSRPSYADIRTLFHNFKIDSSVIVGHDGTVHKISAVNKNFDVDTYWRAWYDEYIRLGKPKQLAEHLALDELYRAKIFIYERW